MIKCYVCRQRTAIDCIGVAMTCHSCTEFLTRSGGHQYRTGETIEEYQARLESTLEMKVGR